jgi:hypothetical protein
MRNMQSAVQHLELLLQLDASFPPDKTIATQSTTRARTDIEDPS